MVLSTQILEDADGGEQEQVAYGALRLDQVDATELLISHGEWAVSANGPVVESVWPPLAIEAPDCGAAALSASPWATRTSRRRA
jgi:hypothetical protein